MVKTQYSGNISAYENKTDSNFRKKKPWSFQAALALLALSIQDELHICFENSISQYTTICYYYLAAQIMMPDAWVYQEQALENIFMKFLSGEK